MEEFVRGNNEFPWTRLMEWFIEAAIGVELFRKHDRSAPPLSFENIRIDGSATILIDPSSTEREPQSISGSLASDFSTISSFFLDIHRTLDQKKQLILPLDDINEALVYSHIMVALLEHFVASGDLTLHDSSPQDYSQYFLDLCDGVLESNPGIELYLNTHLAHLFCRSVLYPFNRDSFVLTPHSFLRGSDVERSEQLLNAVDEVKEIHSLEVVRNLHFDWKEWVTMMEMVEKGVTALTDLSFLQSRCFRPTLEVLQVNHQLRATPPRIEESSRAESSSEDRRSELSHPPFVFNSSIHTTSTISSDTQLPSQFFSSSSDAQILSSPQPHQLHQHPLRQASSIHSLEILTVLHTLLSRPQIKSFPYVLRRDITPEKELEIWYANSRTPVSLNETFGPSVFNETNDKKLMQTLTRCWEVIRSTKSTQCIDDQDSFLTLVIAGVNHSSQMIAVVCANLFLKIINFLPVLDPRADQFRTLRNAFRDGTQVEQRTLLNLWRTWFDPQIKGRTGPSMRVDDFTFNVFLAADMTDTPLFDDACFHFEKNHRVMDRLAGQPGPWSNEIQSKLTFTISHIFFAEMLSIFHGYCFPSELTESIVIDLNHVPGKLAFQIHPMFHLNYTSIAPKHRLSFFPMDLIFERCLRENPDVFFGGHPDLTICSVRKFIYTPVIGLHSLLVRSIPISFNEHTLAVFLNNLESKRNEMKASSGCEELGLVHHHFRTPSNHRWLSKHFRGHNLNCTRMRV
ncbi:hypothetical protein BLNAU_9066 [Blattamonas nauphoetae]|uniref:Uncharacterized protein n=1 Tax=Blattamonas nauphoetae TaxID=2049346 RepID=A0ABQ9XWQ4_9EUKA|nr:hypothetical protein BLNAU_9066 [Blattamonas nauphoetae]